jgi:nucleoside-diphosphate-sugar epimerase
VTTKCRATILVTGATGFIGGHLVAELAARGVRVRALGRDETTLAHLAGPNVESFRADLRDRERIADACRSVDTVYHVGALSSPWGKTADFEAINVGGTETVLEGCRRHGVRRLVYVSSPAVLSNGTHQTNLTDDTPYPAHFTSVYARTKKEGEDRVNAARNDLETVIVRPKAVFGPGDRALLPRLLAAARQGRLPQIGDGTNRVDLTYADNVVHGLLLAGESAVAVGRTYTITNGESPLLWEVITAVLSRLGISPIRRIVPVPVALAVAGLMETAAHTTGKEPLLTRYSVLILARTQTYDISAARRDLGYSPIVSLEEGIERTIAAFTDHPASASVAASC